MRPVFEEKCIRCHGSKHHGGKLDMRTLEVHYREMPPKKKGPFIIPAALGMLRQWINSMPDREAVLTWRECFNNHV